MNCMGLNLESVEIFQHQMQSNDSVILMSSARFRKLQWEGLIPEQIREGLIQLFYSFESSEPNNAFPIVDFCSKKCEFFWTGESF